MTLTVAALCILLIPGWASAQSAPSSAVEGNVKDASGLAVKGAFVTLETSSSTTPRTALTDQAGLFRFVAVEPGNYKITISALGFEPWTQAIAAGENVSAVLKVASASTSVNVTLSPHELAAEQVKAQEKQRVFGLFPDFFVTYAPDAAPLSAAQKFQLGWKVIADPVLLIGTGIAAGIQQARNNDRQFGQGAEGYAKRYGAQYADRVTGVIIGRVVTQAIFHQDPRYFYKGTGSIGSRALYAIGTAFVRKGDNGHWQPDYSDVLGGMAAHQLSSLYYPSTSRPVRRLFDDVLLGFAGRAVDNLGHEFLARKLTPHLPKIAAGLTPRILREATPVALVSVEDWSSKTAESVSVSFLLAADLQVDGVTVAPIGSKASGRATFSGDSAVLDRVTLQVGAMNVPLRKTPQRNGDTPLQFHRLENSGRIAITLYVSQDVAFPTKN